MGGLTVDSIVRAFYEMAFKVAFMEKRADEFQDFFSSIMEKRHPQDFIRTRPWGSFGDRKNDGYLRSERTLFQVYGPNELRETDTVRKIEEDFLGALPHWQQYFDRWVFVHNSKDGLSPGVVEKLLELGKQHSQIVVLPWGFEELRQKTFELTEVNLASLLGAVPARSDLQAVSFDELELVLRHIESNYVPLPDETRAVPPGKIEANGLSEAVRTLLMAGMRASHRVAEFFSKYHDPILGVRVASAFRFQYQKLRDQTLLPDDIFSELQSFAGGRPPNPPRRQAAALTVLAYLFETCDIFERPREGVEV